MCRRFGASVYLISVLFCLPFTTSGQSCIRIPDTSLLFSNIFYSVSDDTISTPVRKLFYSYDDENRVLTSYFIKGFSRPYRENNLWAYSGDGRFQDQKTMFFENGAWSVISSTTTRKYDDVDTVIYENSTNYATLSIYKKNSLGQLIEVDYFERLSDNQWEKIFKDIYEYDSRGNQICLQNEEWKSSLLISALRILTEYNNHNKPVAIRRQSLSDGVWGNPWLVNYYVYDNRNRLVLEGIPDNEKTVYVYTRYCNKSLVSKSKYRYYDDHWVLYNETIDTTDNSGLLIGTLQKDFDGGLLLSTKKFKYEHDRFGNLTSTIYFSLDGDGEWKKINHEDNTYVYITQNKKHVNCYAGKTDGLSEIESFYANPFNFDRQVKLFDSDGELIRIKKLKLEPVGPDFNPEEEITPEQLFNLEKNRNRNMFWRGSISTLLSLQKLPVDLK
jgi:hypothetical protein